MSTRRAFSTLLFFMGLLVSSSSSVIGQTCVDAAGVVRTPSFGCVVNWRFNVRCVGTSRLDLIVGTDGDDVIVGGPGSDFIFGQRGDDVICGGDGNDWVYAGRGDDVVRGGDGYDYISGDAGDDELHGDGDFDTVDGGPQTDVCTGERLKSCENNSPTPTPTATDVATDTPAATATPTPENTSTATATDTATPTSTFTATATDTATPTSTFTATATDTATPTSTFTATPTDTATATSTPTNTFTATATPTIGQNGVINGQVTDASGLPIAGVVVSAGGMVDNTDAGGLYELSGLDQLPRVVVTFEHDDFSTTFGAVMFEPGGPTALRLDRVLVGVSDAQSIDAQAGGTIGHNGSLVNFPPGSIDAFGDVEIVMSTIDPTTAEIGAFPGDFAAVDAGGDPTTLETFALFDVRITQDGLPINLVDGTTATLEFLLPVTTPLGLGQSVALWFFDENTGLWVEESIGTVGASSTTPGRLAVVGEVAHFSWWNCDQPITTFGCVEGTVTDPFGSPVQGASVIGAGVDYSGRSYSSTNSAGAYCMNVRRNSTINVTASLLFGGAIQSETVQVMSPVANATCAGVGCVVAPVLQLSGLSCVAGQVLDQFGDPLLGRPVGSSSGGSDSSAADGSYCVLAPADTDVTMTSPGIAPLLVTTATGGDCSAPATCVQAILQESAGGTETCLSGRVVDDGGIFDLAALSGVIVFGDPVVGAEVTAFNQLEESFGPVLTDANGEFCIPGVTAFSDVFINVQGPAPDFCSGFASDITTGAPGGTCSGGGCTEVGDLTCFTQQPS